MKVIILKGLPASSKSTYAKDLVNKSGGNYKRVSKDDLRLLLDNGKWSGKNEKFILKVRDSILLEAIQNGYSVIVDDTNLHPKHIPHIKELVKSYEKVNVETKFFDVDVMECIRRDKERTVGHVGEKVIMDMYNKYLREEDKKDVEAYPYDMDLETCCIIDIDGTLSRMGGRSPYEWDKVFLDDPNMPIIRLVSYIHSMHGIHNVFIFSGRDSVCRTDTVKWLRLFGISFDGLYMRAVNDCRKDIIVKKEMFDKYIRGKYNVEFILDDRNCVVQMWRSMGLTCLQVADGNF